MFVDTAKIKIKAGDGGDGAVSFHREKYVAAGGPDGGDGGRGGNIVFVADSNLSTLADFRYKRKYAAKKGENGRGGRCRGKNAEDLVIRVPVGTVVKRRTAEESLPMFRVMNLISLQKAVKAVGAIHILQLLSVRFPVLQNRDFRGKSLMLFLNSSFLPM